MIRAIEPWVAAPLRSFLDESEARLVLLTTSSGQVIAQHGFARSVDVMAAASLGAAIVASTGELSRVMGAPGFRTMVQQGEHQSFFIQPFETPRGRWIGLVVFGTETSVGVVQLFFDQLADQLAAAAPVEQQPTRPALAEHFERELNASLRALFGR